MCFFCCVTTSLGCFTSCFNVSRLMWWQEASFATEWDYALPQAHNTCKWKIACKVKFSCESSMNAEMLTFTLISCHNLIVCSFSLIFSSINLNHVIVQIKSTHFNATLWLFIVKKMVRFGKVTTSVVCFSCLSDSQNIFFFDWKV